MDCQTARCTSPNSQMEGEWKFMRSSDDSLKSKESERRSQPSPQPSFDDELTAVDSRSDDSTIGYIEGDPDGQCQEEQFDKTFVKVLLKYLELKDIDMREQAIAIIKDCGKRKQRNKPRHGSAKDTMKALLMELVGENYWKKAKTLQHLTKLQQEIGSKVGLANNHFDRCFTLGRKTAQTNNSKDTSRQRKLSFDRKADALRSFMQSHHPDGGYAVPKYSDKVRKMLARGWAKDIRQYRKKQNGEKSAKDQIEQLESFQSQIRNKTGAIQS